VAKWVNALGPNPSREISLCWFDSSHSHRASGWGATPSRKQPLHGSLASLAYWQRTGLLSLSEWVRFLQGAYLTRPISSADRATDFESVCREFDSLMGHTKEYEVRARVGSPPTRPLDSATS
jgi:hypothetical protein